MHANKAMKQADRFVTSLAGQGPRRERPQLIASALGLPNRSVMLVDKVVANCDCMFETMDGEVGSNAFE